MLGAFGHFNLWKCAVSRLPWHQLEGLLPSSGGTEPAEQHKMVTSDDREKGEQSPGPG